MLLHVDSVLWPPDGTMYYDLLSRRQYVWRCPLARKGCRMKKLKRNASALSEGINAR